MIITSQELAEAIELKLHEILAPLMEELKKVESRIKTLYITGGGSMTENIDRAGGPGTGEFAAKASRPAPLRLT